MSRFGDPKQGFDTDGPVLQLFNEWERSGKMTYLRAEVVDRDFDLLMMHQLNQVEYTLHTQPYTALSQLASLSSFISLAALKRPSILLRLEGWIAKVKDITSRLANKLEADAFEIGIGGWPPSVSVSLSRDTEPDED